MSNNKVYDLTTFPPPPRIPPLASSSNKKKKWVLFFWAPWHDESKPGGIMDEVLTTLASSSSSSGGNGVSFGRIEAEACPELSVKFGVTIVPTFILVDEDCITIIDKIEGVDPAKVTEAVRNLITTTTSTTTTTGAAAEPSPPSEEGTLDEKLNKLVNTSEVMLFMKGSPTLPKCGFSRQIVELLTDSNIPYSTFDILDPSAQDVRQGLKTKYDWPTYPQLYVKGELVGGLDIIKEMVEDTSEDLATQLGVEKTMKEGSSLDERLKQLINRNRVMLFMKGLPSSPRCGFSRQIVDILNDGTPAPSYDTFDILQDEEVRQGLKVYSDWPTFPQLYVDGELVGGLDIVKEMDESGELKELLLSPSPSPSPSSSSSS